MDPMGNSKQIHPPETKKNGKPGDQNVCLQCGHWSVAQRVDVYAGNRFLYPLEIKRGNRKSRTNGGLVDSPFHIA